MVQKQRQKDSTKFEDIAEGVSETVTSDSKSSRGGTLSRLYSAITKEGSAGTGALAGFSTAMLGLIVAGILPTTILPLLAGFALGGAVLGKVIPDDVYSVMGGVGVASFLTFFLFVNIPILGLGLISTIIFTVLATGATTATHQYFSDNSV